MDFEALLWQAIRRCDGQVGLARTLGYNKNSIRQWLLGLSLPDVGVEPRLAQLAGVTPDLLRQAIRDEMMRRWDRARNQPTTRRGRLGRPPQLADPLPLPVVGQRVARPKNASDKKRRRGQTVTALLASMGLGLATLSHAAAASASDAKDSVARRREAA
jgi:transcriptional regulator with XRE-family HTH domain